MDDMMESNNNRQNSRNSRRLAVLATGVVAAGFLVASKGHPESLVITIGAYFTFLLVFRLADPVGDTA
ncbi:MAG: hypothetical protein GWO44_05150 [Thermoplasmata archaeon]|nr:hypothetical protein [Thermoplasmata archaeon]NIY02676.1 hypothetical protein [Thermoplasmata archaeon]